MRLTANSALSAIYYALLQCGYDDYTLARDEAHCSALRPFTGVEAAPAFFAGARQATCQVYRYWPRAFILESAALSLTEDCTAYRDWSGFRQHIGQLGNLAEEERGEALWTWLAGFPAALRQVMASAGFRRYRLWEDRWLAAQTTQHEGALLLLTELLDQCTQHYASPVRQIEIVISPIKCVYSSDCHLTEGRFLFVSGSFRVDSVIHEFLHHVVHPAAAAMADRIPVCRYPGLDDSYYAAGPLSAFEEHAVRSLTAAVLARHFPNDLPAYLNMLLLAAEKEFRHD